VETALGILGFAALFVAFGMFRPGADRGCGGNCGSDCASDGSACLVPSRGDDPITGTFREKEL
jgi:hypothetical protein